MEKICNHCNSIASSLLFSIMKAILILSLSLSLHFVPFHDHLCMNSEMENSIRACRGSLVSSALEWLWHLCEILLTIIKWNFTMNGINENHRGLIEDHAMKSHFPFLQAIFQCSNTVNQFHRKTAFLFSFPIKNVPIFPFFEQFKKAQYQKARKREITL